ncbi:MAG: DUF5711 family protein [Lachnospiraceae bacterium]
MRSKNRRNLRVVQPKADPTDEIIDQIMEELNEEEPLDNLEAKIASHRKKFWIRVTVIAVSVLAVAIAIYLFFNLQTYDSVQVVDTVASDNGDGSYASFAGGILKYSKDGVSFLKSNGKEQWNHSYQIKNPIIDVNGDVAAIADSSGNAIAVFDGDGLKGEITTTLPIEKISVSQQGIVAAILKNDNSPNVICYDSAGNILVEHKASVTSTGYPIDISMSANGELLLVTYLYTQDNEVKTKISFFNFGDVGQDKTDHLVAEAEYQDAIMPEAFFISEDTSVVVGDKQILIYNGAQIPELKNTVELEKEIKSVFHNDKYIGLILKNEGKEGCELCIYSTAGKQVMSTDFAGEYSHVKLVDGQIIMYDGDQMAIYTLSGRKRFEGQVDANILEVVPMLGFNKYLVMSTSGIQTIRLVK